MFRVSGTVSELTMRTLPRRSTQLTLNIPASPRPLFNEGIVRLTGGG